MDWSTFCPLVFSVLSQALTVIGDNRGSFGIFGPKYPITGAWFKDRFSKTEWNRTLSDFAKQDGDTILLGAPPIRLQNKSDLLQDPDFKYCGNTGHYRGIGTGVNCFDIALEDITSAGLKFAGFATYRYEENYGSSFLKCSSLDKKIISSRIYNRIILPVKNTASSCPYPKGTEVYILFTVFNGVDPHELLLESAKDHNMSVYFSLPSAPRDQKGLTFYVEQFMNPYYELVGRIVKDHKQRYSNILTKKNGRKSNSLYDTIKGYYVNDEVPLVDIDNLSYQFMYIQNVGNLIRNIATGKKFIISAIIEMNINLDGTGPVSLKRQKSKDAVFDAHVHGFEVLANSSVIDIVGIYEGRGAGRGAYYWQTVVNRPISVIDPTLDKIIRYRNSMWPENVTFGEVFSASNQQLFSAIGKRRDELNDKSASKTDFWFILEAFEYLRDTNDMCLPVDPAGSGNSQMLDRTVKSRLDRSLTGAGATSQKIVTFAWDPDFTCTSEAHNYSLATQIRNDYNRPIIADCFFHSFMNRSVVAVGYNLESFTVNWPDYQHKRHTDSGYGYYFEMDWGYAHQRLESVMYTQLYDVYDVVNLASKGWVTVTPTGSYHSCTFVYNFDD